MKPANEKIRVLYRKLQALAERGMDGEKEVAHRKLARLTARYDFSVPAANDTLDLFSGRFASSSAARRIYSFNRNELDVANAVKWAIESATRIRCAHRGAELLAEATPHGAKIGRNLRLHHLKFSLAVGQVLRVGRRERRGSKRISHGVV